MGLERHGAALFLKLRSDGVKFGRLLTLGHQSMSLEPDDYRGLLKKTGRETGRAVPQFADDLFLALGAEEVRTLDFSPYEGAQLVHDLNEPVPKEWHQQYDIVFDGGTLEHVFNFPIAIRNCMQMLRAGGRFISVAPPNNWCGHGFYQFSPELFYQVFSTPNGFSVVEMYIAEVGGRTFAVKDPTVVKSRVELCNDRRVYLLVHARRDLVCEIFNQTPQQSDYVTAWAGPPLATPRPPRAWKNLPLIKHLRTMRRKLLLRSQLRNQSLENRELYTPVNLTI